MVKRGGDCAMTRVRSNLKLDRRALLAAAVTALAPTRTAAQQANDSAPIVREAADAIEREYHDASAGRAARAALLRNFRRGRYSGRAAGDLAEALTADAQTVLSDDHFMIMYGVMDSNPGGGPSRPHEEAHRPTPADLDFLRAQNFGVHTVQVLPGNIGRIDIRAFYRPIEEVRTRYAAAMTFLADTSAIIVDCTQNIGGDPKSVALFASYFFEREPFVINRFHWRNLPLEEFMTTRAPGGPLYGDERPVVVATSASSFSAAEEFAYDMQAFQRGVVVGEKTPGAANHALPVIIAGAFTAFIPQARAENPVTRANWEGAGITPDISADGAQIASVAHRVALERVVATESGDRRTRAEAALSRLRAQ
jgi:retinol-binding protein 3